jgi:hypothetical protein
MMRSAEWVLYRAAIGELLLEGKYSIQTEVKEYERKIF